MLLVINFVEMIVKNTLASLSNICDRQSDDMIQFKYI